MSKQYEFEVTYKINESLFKNKIVATGILDAKNKIKSKTPNAKIIACVKGNEYISIRQQYLNDEKKAQQRKAQKDESSSSLGGALLGLAAVVGIALTSHLFKKD